MTTPPAAAARTSARAATKTRLAAVGGPPPSSASSSARQRSGTSASRLGLRLTISSSASATLANTRSSPTPRPRPDTTPASSAAWRRSSTRWRHAWPDPVTATALPAPAARPATIPDTSRCGDGVAAGPVTAGASGTPRTLISTTSPHEAEAPPVDRSDQALIAPVVADRSPGGLDAARQGRLGDEPVAPDLVEQLGLRDDPVAVPDEVVEHVHDLWLDRDLLAATLELHRVGVERHVSESHPHRRQHRAARGRGGVLHTGSTPAPSLRVAGGGRSEATRTPHRSP